VDREDAMRRLLDFGVDGMFTNQPDRLRALVDPPGEERSATAERE
jgi:glycerophosphoryl diester phosphodiesterase